MKADISVDCAVLCLAFCAKARSRDDAALKNARAPRPIQILTTQKHQWQRAFKFTPSLELEAILLDIPHGLY
jgi:hypothetical protein